MELFKAMNISATGLRGEAKRIDIITNNITNQNTINPDGTPYQRQIAQFKEKFDQSVSFVNGKSEKNLEGLEYTGVALDDAPFKSVYDPTSPYADTDGMVKMPNVDIMQEMTDLIIANRSYSANAQAFNSAKAFYMKAMEIGK